MGSQRVGYKLATEQQDHCGKAYFLKIATKIFLTPHAVVQNSFATAPSIFAVVWRRKWQPTLVLLPGESHGGSSLVGYSPWGCRVGHD